MKGVTLRNGKSNGQIAVMAEALKLKIDEEGAKVESKASCIQDECAIMYVDTRHYYLNKKFWVVMKEIGKFPYLCVHINDPVEA